MISYAVLSRGALLEDADNKHYRAKHLKVISDPPMSVLADGVLLGQGSMSVHIHPRALTVMAGSELTGEITTAKLTRDNFLDSTLPLE